MPPEPLSSIAEEATKGTIPLDADGTIPDAPQGPSFGDRALELFKPCPENPMDKAGFISQQVNGFLSRRSGVPESDITVGENLAHCVDHLVPGGGSGLPPILGLIKSVLDYKGELKKLAQPPVAHK